MTTKTNSPLPLVGWLVLFGNLLNHQKTMTIKTKYTGAMLTETAAGWVAGDEMGFDSMAAAQSHGEERLRNEEESARPAKLTWRFRELEPSLPNV
jgi:hypothetical protein